jgi:low affinity Fe/Cu permease
MKRGRFEELAERAAKVAGSHYAFGTVCIGVVLWAATGPYFHYSDTWQLLINTSTTIITCLMTLLIQNSTNRYAAATAAMLAELIRSNEKARNEFIGLEQKAEKDIVQAAEAVKQAAVAEAAAIEPYFLRRLMQRKKRGGE